MAAPAEATAATLPAAPVAAENGSNASVLPPNASVAPAAPPAAAVPAAAEQPASAEEEQAPPACKQS